MQETQSELAALQLLLDSSLRRAGSHLTGIITDSSQMTAQQIVDELVGMKVLVLATVTAKGEPRTSCVDGHFLHGTWLFSTSASAHKARHLRARPALSTTHSDGERMAVFTHGYANYVTAAHPEFAGYDEYFTGCYGSSPTTWAPDIVFVTVRPTWMVGYRNQ